MSNASSSPRGAASSSALTSRLVPGLSALLLAGALAGCGNDPSGDEPECETNFDCPRPFEQQCVGGACVDPEDASDTSGDPDDVDTDAPDVTDTTDVVDEDGSDIDTDVDEPDDVDTDVPDGSGDTDASDGGDECGDGNVSGAEECDDGNTDNGDGCSADCLLEWYCGDGELNTDEQCDDGNNFADDGCSPECEIESECGDGTVDEDEQCDDGNTDDGDGCSATCRTEGVVVPTPLNNPWLAFVTRPSGLDQITLIRTSGGDRRALATGDALQYDPAWSPDGRRVAYRIPAAPNRLLKVIDVTTGTTTTHDPGIPTFANPSFSPGGNRVVFEGRRDSESSSEIFILDLRTNALTQVTDTPHSEAVPVWVSSDVIYYVSNATGSFDAYRHVLSDGTTERRSFAPIGIVGGVQVSWDERYLLYRSRTGPETGELVLMDTETFETFVVGSDRATSPAMSPDGLWFAFVERIDGQADIVLMDLETRTLAGSRVTSDVLVEDQIAIGPVESEAITLGF